MYCAFLVNDGVMSFVADSAGNLMLFTTYDEVATEVRVRMEEYKEQQGYPVDRVEIKQIFHRCSIEGD